MSLYTYIIYIYSYMYMCKYICICIYVYVYVYMVVARHVHPGSVMSACLWDWDAGLWWRSCVC